MKKGCVRDESDAVWERGMRDVWDQGHNDVIAKKIVCVVTLTGVGFKVLCL